MKHRVRSPRHTTQNPRWPYFSFPGFSVFLFFSSLSLFLCSCGYHWIGRAEPVGPEAQLIAVPTWLNQTDIRGIEAVFTRRLIETIEQRGRARVVPRKKAEAVLEGKIISISALATSFEAGGSAAVDYQLRVVVGIRLIRTRDGEVIWQIPSLIEEGYYDARAEPLKQENSQEDALARAAEAIARGIVDRWGGDW
jgi:hypothetical protein